MSTIKERLTDFLSYKGIGQIKFAEYAGLSRGFVNILGDGISSKSLNKISKAFPELNTLWLTTGEGNMINSGMIIGENKGNAAQSIAGNMVNVTMPESGTQKIIKPTGEVEIHRLDPSDKSNSEELDRLKQRIQDLERIIAEKDATIQSKDDTIKSKDELISFLKGDRQ